MKVSDYVRIGKGCKVYQIQYADNHPKTGVRMFKLAATAGHPDAAKREQDAWAWYPAERLTPVERHQRRRRNELP